MRNRSPKKMAGVILGKHKGKSTDILSRLHGRSEKGLKRRAGALRWAIRCLSQEFMSRRRTSGADVIGDSMEMMCVFRPSGLPSAGRQDVNWMAIDGLHGEASAELVDAYFAEELTLYKSISTGARSRFSPRWDLQLEDTGFRTMATGERSRAAFMLILFKINFLNPNRKICTKSRQSET